MTKQQIAQAIESYISGQGNQAGLQGLADILHALNNETETVVMADVPYITTISALQTVEMTADQATAAGFTMDVIMQLTRVAHPTIKFCEVKSSISIKQMRLSFLKNDFMDVKIFLLMIFG